MTSNYHYKKKDNDLSGKHNTYETTYGAAYNKNNNKNDSKKHNSNYKINNQQENYNNYNNMNMNNLNNINNFNKCFQFSCEQMNNNLNSFNNDNTPKEDYKDRIIKSSPFFSNNFPFIYDNFLKVGLNNLGSTCYINSCLQLLLHVPELVEYLHKLKSNSNFNYQPKLSDSFKKLIDNILDKKNYQTYTNSYSPDDFKYTLAKLNPQFSSFASNDAKDLLLYILEKFHDELNLKKKYNPSSTNNDLKNEYNREKAFIASQNNYDNENKSIISYLFYGTHENISACGNCGNSIFEFQVFNFLSFSLYNFLDKNFSLEDGFKQMNELIPGNDYYCNNCGKKVNSMHQVFIYNPPKYLFIYLDYGKNKIYQPRNIFFPESLDNIQTYISNTFNENYNYYLIGVLTHLGQSGNQGHFITFFKNIKENRWYRFSDSLVSDCNSNDIYGGSPYILLYVRV